MATWDDEHTTELMRLGAEDLDAARAMAEDVARFPDRIVGFHLQQAAEKFLKALLHHKHQTYLRTHDMQILIDHVERAGVSVPEAVAQIALVLYPYAVDLRYGELMVSSRFDRIQGVHGVASIQQWVLGHIKGD